VGIEIDLRIHQCACQLLYAVRWTTLRKFMGEVLGMVRGDVLDLLEKRRGALARVVDSGCLTERRTPHAESTTIGAHQGSDS
jgi:hypothetical protein